MTLRKTFISIPLVALALTACQGGSKKENIQLVQSAGILKEAIWKKDLGSKIDADTLSTQHLYGVGPLVNLRGDQVIFNGKTYLSEVVNDSIITKEGKPTTSPYFVYQYVPKWIETPFSSDIENERELGIFVLSRKELNKQRESSFKMEGTFKALEIAVHNLPAKLSHYNYSVGLIANKKHYLKDVEGTIIGFFDAERTMKFTHHDEQIVMYFISKDLKQVGRVTQLHLDHDKTKFFLPKY